MNESNTPVSAGQVMAGPRPLSIDLPNNYYLPEAMLDVVLSRTVVVLSAPFSIP